MYPPDKPDPRKRHFAELSAFSLIEVVMAIGLSMFALLVIFSLIPTGLNSLQETNRQFVETEIFNKVSAEFQSTPFNQLEQYVQDRFPIYFDNEGGEIDSPTEAIFTARCELAEPELNDELRRATVSIGFRVDPGVSGPSRNSNVEKRSFLFADRGQ